MASTSNRMSGKSMLFLPVIESVSLSGWLSQPMSTGMGMATHVSPIVRWVHIDSIKDLTRSLHRVVEVLYHSFFLLDYCYHDKNTSSNPHFLLLLYIQNIPVKSIQLGWISYSIPYNTKMWDTAGVFVITVIQ